MVATLKGARLLQGFRGRAPADEDAVREAVLRISALVAICPEIQELDVNPLMVLTEGVSAPDVRVSLAIGCTGTMLPVKCVATRLCRISDPILFGSRLAPTTATTRSEECCQIGRSTWS